LKDPVDVKEHGDFPVPLGDPQNKIGFDCGPECGALLDVLLFELGDFQDPSCFFVRFVVKSVLFPAWPG
jgi:hypothetical protein